MDQTINANFAQCIKYADHFGYTEYTNICNGAQHIVRWGGMDWVVWGLIVGFIGVMIIGMLAFVWSMTFGDW